jgi:hypothetical protein
MVRTAIKETGHQARFSQRALAWWGGGGLVAAAVAAGVYFLT